MFSISDLSHICIPSPLGFVEFFAVIYTHLYLSLSLPEYVLVAFISHMGTSTMCGHYVCHIKKEGKWIIFNDNKVAESVAPPKDLAYLYLYKRVAA